MEKQFPVCLLHEHILIPDDCTALQSGGGNSTLPCLFLRGHTCHSIDIEYCLQGILSWKSICHVLNMIYGFAQGMSSLSKRQTTGT